MKRFVFYFLIALSQNCTAQPVVSFQAVVSGLSDPVDVVEVNDSSKRLFIVERTGTIRIWHGLSLLTEPFLNVAHLITSEGGEQGLLSLAFHPQYGSNGYFYIYYTNTSGSVTVARYSRHDANTADATSGVVLMTIAKRFSNHNGGNLEFGPDGYLYFGTGDGGSGGDPDQNAQNGASLLGKLLRIDVNNPDPPYYKIPPTNPFAGSTTTRPEIIATGLRNPWRFSFDKQTGDLWIADVGQNNWEEINHVPAAGILNRNYGWNCLEGTHVFNASCTAQANNVTPVFEYGHNNDGGYSVTGGYIYRGAAFPALQGYYLSTDFVSRNGWLTWPDGAGGWNTTLQRNWEAGISSFGETAAGELYAVTLSGTLYKVIASGTLPVHLVSFTGKEAGGVYNFNWLVQNEEKGDVYILETKSEGGSFRESGRIRATNSSGSNGYTFQLPARKVVYCRLKIAGKDGQVHYSSILFLTPAGSQVLKAFIRGDQLQLTLPEQTSCIELYDAAGRLFSRQVVNSIRQMMNLSLDKVARGVITAKVLTGNNWQSARVIY